MTAKWPTVTGSGRPSTSATKAAEAWCSWAATMWWSRLAMVVLQCHNVSCLHESSGQVRRWVYGRLGYRKLTGAPDFRVATASLSPLDSPARAHDAQGDDAPPSGPRVQVSSPSMGCAEVVPGSQP